MIHDLINWLSSLPTGPVYAVVGLLAAVENIFPPVPADTAIMLGAFLAHRGVTTPWLVFIVTIACNMASAMGMYFLGARHASALFRSSIARRLLPDDGVAFVQREYQRYGLIGLGIGRLLPGFRAVIPPFAGMLHIGPLRTLAVMLVASSLWYGGLIFVAAKLGEHWEELVTLVTRINQGLAIAAGAVLLLIAIGVWRRVRRSRV